MAKSTFSIYDSGMDGTKILVESQLSNGLPATIIVGMANKSVDEAKERLRSAFVSSGLTYPRKRITINLAPADEPKTSATLDLSIALSILLASNPELSSRDLSKVVFIGELGLDGSIKSSRGILGKIISAKKHDFETIVLPENNAQQASLVKGINIVPVRNLTQALEWLQGKDIKYFPEDNNNAHVEFYETSFSDVIGHEVAKRCLEIAAAGGHNIILNGPPGTGKSMLAKSIPSILPRLNLNQVIETTHIHSLVNNEAEKIIYLPPFQSPHHSSSSVAIIGGGQNARPGEISMAHNGVLFLDELPEYRRDCLEALRQPLEDQVITISRAKKSVQYPARFILVATKNPCPCGFYGTKKPCSCSAYDIARYNKKLSGPIIDRIDLYTDVEEIPYELLVKKKSTEEDKTEVSNRIKLARTRQLSRNPKNKLNSQLTNKDLTELNLISDEANDFLVNAARKLQLSARSFIKTLRVSVTISDLEQSDCVSKKHITEALQYRNRPINI